MTANDPRDRARSFDDTRIAVAEASGQHLDETTSPTRRGIAAIHDPAMPSRRCWTCSSGADLLQDSRRQHALARPSAWPERVSSAAITNAESRTLESSLRVALRSARSGVRKVRIDTLGDYLAPHVAFPGDRPRPGRVRAAGCAFDTVRPPIDALKACVALGGDTDSTAAISLGLASLSIGDLPADSALENAYGRDIARRPPGTTS